MRILLPALIAAAVLPVTLAGCGQQGPLYLPVKPPRTIPSMPAAAKHAPPATSAHAPVAVTQSGPPVTPPH